MPGGRSTSSTSGSSQNTSVTKLVSALCSIGPRQMTGLSSWVMKPIDMMRTPCDSTGRMRSSTMTGDRLTPIMRGIE